jgi:hypothetical protein
MCKGLAQLLCSCWQQWWWTVGTHETSAVVPAPAVLLNVLHIITMYNEAGRRLQHVENGVHTNDFAGVPARIDWLDVCCATGSGGNTRFCVYRHLLLLLHESSLWRLCTVRPCAKAAARVVAFQHHLVLAATAGLHATGFDALCVLLDHPLGLLFGVHARLLSWLHGTTRASVIHVTY